MPISTVHEPAQVGRTAAAAPRPTTIGMVSTYPPTQCGLATFSAALVEHLHLFAGVARSGAGGRRGRAAARSGCGGPAGERLPGQCRRRGSSPQRLRRGGRPARVRHLRRAGRRGRPGNRRRADGAGDRRAAHGPAGSDGAAAAHPAAAARHGRRRRDPDADRQETAHRELRSRSGAARGDPARRGRPRAVVLGRARARRPPARPHLGTDRTRARASSGRSTPWRGCATCNRATW